MQRKGNSSKALIYGADNREIEIESSNDDSSAQPDLPRFVLSSVQDEDDSISDKMA